MLWPCFSDNPGSVVCADGVRTKPRNYDLHSLTRRRMLAWLTKVTKGMSVHYGSVGESHHTMPLQIRDIRTPCTNFQLHLVLKAIEMARVTYCSGYLSRLCSRCIDHSDQPHAPSRQWYSRETPTARTAPSMKMYLSTVALATLCSTGIASPFQQGASPALERGSHIKALIDRDIARSSAGSPPQTSYCYCMDIVTFKDSVSDARTAAVCPGELTKYAPSGWDPTNVCADHEFRTGYKSVMTKRCGSGFEGECCSMNGECDYDGN